MLASRVFAVLTVSLPVAWLAQIQFDPDTNGVAP
jgi:hypothetical protein